MKAFIETDALIGLFIAIVSIGLICGLAYVHVGLDQTITQQIDLIDQEVMIGLSNIDTCIVTYVPQEDSESDAMEMDEMQYGETSSEGELYD